MDPLSTTRTLEQSSAKAVAVSRAHLAVGVILLVLILAGTVMRMQGLGTLGLVGDEGYQYQAVRAVLDHGVPRMDTGYVYLRAPHFIYLQAGVAAVFGLDEATLRVPAVFFGVLAIPLGYLLGRDLVDARAGVLLAAFLAVSVWEIELSRYARFYTLLQACYISGLLCFWHGYIKGKARYKLAYWAVTLVAILTHQLGVMLALCFVGLLPLPGYSVRARLGYGAQFLAGGVLYIVAGRALDAVAAALFGGDYIALSGAEMEAIQEQAAGRASFHPGNMPGVSLPSFPMLHALWDTQRPAAVGLLTMAALGAVAAVWLMARSKRWLVGGLSAIALVYAGLQLGAASAAVLMVLFAVAVRQRRDLLQPVVLVGWAGSMVLLAGYVLAAKLFLGEGLLSGCVDLLHYPDIDRYLLRWLRLGWPVVGLLAVVGLGFAAWRSRDEAGTCTGRWLLMTALVLPVLAASLVAGKHNESRYFFYLYPLILLLAVLALLEAGDLAGRIGRHRRAVTATLTLLLLGVLVLSPDLKPASAWAVGSRGYGFTADPMRHALSYPFYCHLQQDQASVGKYVRQNRGPGERLLLVGPPHRVVNFTIYAGQADYVLGNVEYYTRLSRDKQGRLMDPDTGAEIILDAERLREVLQEAEAEGGLWVLGDGGVWLDWPVLLNESMQHQLFVAVTGGEMTTGLDDVSFASHLTRAPQPVRSDPSPSPDQP